jgi:hypothetical protein
MVLYATFFCSLVLLVAFGALRTHEMKRGARYLAGIRAKLDGLTQVAEAWIKRHATPEALWEYLKAGMAHTAHHVARGTARVAHSLEYQARTVVHKTSKRVRRDMHYLEAVLEEKLDSDEKKGNNAASE